MFPPATAPTPARAWGLLGVRLGAVLVFTGVMWAVASGFFDDASFPPNTLWATLGLLPVNVLCLVLVRRLYRAAGQTLVDALGVRRGRVGRDLLWGLLWLVVLNVPFGAAVAGTVFAMYGADAPAAFETVFFDSSLEQYQDPAMLLVIGLISVLPFMVLNAPAEELVFRGYGLRGLERRLGPVAAVACTSVLFGLQHILFAPSRPGMVVYFVAFTVWGTLAAVIVRKQGRLFPVVIAHWVVNFALSSPAIVFPILQLAGVLAAR